VPGFSGCSVPPVPGFSGCSVPPVPGFSGSSVPPALGYSGIEGLGFAIPIDVAWSAAKDLMEYGYVKGKVYLGIEVAEATGNFISSGTIYPAGVYILESEYSEFSPYDRIVSVGGISVNGMSDYYAAISKLTIGQSVELTISRKDGRSFSEIHVTITVREYVPNNA
jgi:serine protease Do